MTYPEKTQIRIHGNVTKDPELKHVGDEQKAIVEFGLAVDLSPDRETKVTEFYDVTVWSENLHESILAEIHKGSKVVLSGTMTLRQSGDRVYKKISAYRVGIIEWLRPQAVVAKPAQDGEDW